MFIKKYKKNEEFWVVAIRNPERCLIEIISDQKHSEDICILIDIVICKIIIFPKINLVLFSIIKCNEITRFSQV